MSSSMIKNLYNEVMRYFLDDANKDDNYDTIRLKVFKKYGSGYILSSGDSYSSHYKIIQKLEDYCDLFQYPLRHSLIKLKRIKKQLITYCLELLSLEWNEGVLVLMRRISSPRHCWRIIQDKSLPYSHEFVNKIFYENQRI